MRKHIQRKKDKLSTQKMRHVLQTSNRKLKPSASNAANSFNFLEVCVLCAIMLVLKKKTGGQCRPEDVHSMYNPVIDSLLEFGIILPLERRRMDAVFNEFKKLEKDFDENCVCDQQHTTVCLLHNSDLFVTL